MERVLCHCANYSHTTSSPSSLLACAVIAISFISSVTTWFCTFSNKQRFTLSRLIIITLKNRPHTRELINHLHASDKDLLQCFLALLLVLKDIKTCRCGSNVCFLGTSQGSNRSTCSLLFSFSYIHIANFEDNF